MLYSLLRPALFLLPPEAAHAITLKMLQIAQCIGLPRVEYCQRAETAASHGTDLHQSRGSRRRLRQERPVHRCALGRSGFGFIEIGTVTPRPQSGNPEPRLFLIAAGASSSEPDGISKPEER